MPLKKTLLTVFLLSFQIVAFSQTSSPDLRKIHPISGNVPVESRPIGSPFTGINENSGISNNENSKNGPVSPMLVNTTIGATTYDLQTNGSLGNKIYFLNDTIGAIWNSSQSFNPPFDKGTGYNVYTGTSWNPVSPYNMDSVFFSTIDIGSNNTEYVVGHGQSFPNDLFLLKRSPAGSGTWQKSVLPPHPQGNFCLWAKMAVGGTNGESIHVIALTAPTSSPGGTLIDGMNGAMTYSRSQDGGISWDIVHEFLPGIDSTNYRTMLPESYAIDTKGNIIAIVQGSLINDWVLWKSTDNGTTWNRNVAWAFPLQAYDPFNSNSHTDVDGDGWPDTLEFVDSAIEVLIDNNGLVHSWAGRMRFRQFPTMLLELFPNTDGLYYWNENFIGLNPLILTSAVDLDTNGVITIEPFIANYERSLTSMPSAGVDSANNIYLVYSSVKENTSSGGAPAQSYRNTYSMVSSDGGDSWSLPVNVFDSDFDEIVYPSLARQVGPDLHITVQVDGMPGTSFSGGGAVGNNDILYISKDVNTLFAGVPIIQLPNRRLSGNVYYDQNQNGIKDTADFGLNNYDVSIIPSGTIISTNSQGNFLYNTVPGNYVITNSIPPSWQLTSDSASYSVNLVNGSIDSLNFGVFPTVSTYLVEPTLIAGWPRCNMEINYWIDFHNSGTTFNSGTVRFIKDPQLGFLSSYPLYTSASVDTFEWNYIGLMPFENRRIRITTSSAGLFPGDTVVNVGEVIFNTASSTATNSVDMIQAITCSFDPNDKIVTPEGVDLAHYTLKTDTLQYTIRFQNTGNDTAFVVKIRDTLSSFLDKSTFDFIGSSHPVNIVRQANGAMLFTFNNILLPDSTSNFAESSGYISYLIRALPGIASGTVVNNTAHIYFDYNPAIVTNTTFNTMVDFVGIEDHIISGINLIAVPNPFLEDVTILFSETLSDSHSLCVSDIAGRVVMQLKNITGKQVQLPLENVTSGIYFCDVVNKNGVTVGRLKIIKQ